MTLLSTLIFIKHFMYYSKTTEYAETVLEHIMGCAFCNYHVASVQKVEKQINTIAFQSKGITMVMCGWALEPQHRHSLASGPSAAPCTGKWRLPGPQSGLLALHLSGCRASAQPLPRSKSLPPGPLLPRTFYSPLLGTSVRSFLLSLPSGKCPLPAQTEVSLRLPVPVQGLVFILALIDRLSLWLSICLLASM